MYTLNLALIDFTHLLRMVVLAPIQHPAAACAFAITFMVMATIINDRYPNNIEISQAAPHPHMIICTQQLHEINTTVHYSPASAMLVEIPLAAHLCQWDDADYGINPIDDLPEELTCGKCGEVVPVVKLGPITGTDPTQTYELACGHFTTWNI
jgi:hypothetical protein